MPSGTRRAGKAVAIDEVIGERVPCREAQQRIAQAIELLRQERPRSPLPARPAVTELVAKSPQARA